METESVLINNSLPSTREPFITKFPNTSVDHRYESDFKSNDHFEINVIGQTSNHHVSRIRNTLQSSENVKSNVSIFSMFDFMYLLF